MTFCFKLFAMLWILATRSVFGADATQDGSAADDAELQRLRGLAVEAVKALPAEQGKKWSDFLSQSKDFAETHPSLKIWLLRATAALANNDDVAGKEAASKLISLNALSSKDDLVKQIMAGLFMKGWLSVPTPAATTDTTPMPDPTVDETVQYLTVLLARTPHITIDRDKPAEYVLSYSVDGYDSSTNTLRITETHVYQPSGKTDSQQWTLPILGVQSVKKDGSFVDILISDPSSSEPEEKYICLQDETDSGRIFRALQHLVEKLQGKDIFEK